MTIIFNGGADPEEVKFNGQDMETVIFNGVTVWEKVVGVEYTITSGNIPGDPDNGWYNGLFGSISPSPSDSFFYCVATPITNTVSFAFTSNPGGFPDKIKFDGVIYNISPFVSDPIFGNRSINPEATLQPFYNSLAIVGNNTTFELIYP